MISSSSRQWSQAASRQKTVPIRTFQDLQLEKKMYNASQKLRHNSNLAKKFPKPNERVVRNVGKNLHKFVIDDQVMITNNGPHFKLEHDKFKQMNARLDVVEKELGSLKMKISNLHIISCQSEFLNVLRDMAHVSLDKNIPDGMFSEVTRRLREARNIEVHHVTLKGCMDACRKFMAEKDSPLEWEAMFEAFFEVSLGEAKMKLIPLLESSPDFQIEAIMDAQANLLLSCQMDQFPNVFQKWHKAVLEYFDLEQVVRSSSKKPEPDDNSTPLCEARKHIQELAVECLKCEKEDRARAASNGMVTGFPISKELLEKRHAKWKEEGQWEHLVKLSEM